MSRGDVDRGDYRHSIHEGEGEEECLKNLKAAAEQGLMK
jgi:predicted RNase H-like HicB family nuclease